MPQWFRVDRPDVLAYLALGLAGCRPGAPPALMPTGLATVESAQVTQWVNGTTPSSGVMHRFTWLYEEDGPSKGGRGSARIAAPDTLRFDIAGSLGIGKGSALVVGREKQWVVPEKSVEDLVPSFPLLWALLGVAIAPEPGAALAGLELQGRVAWRYAQGPDTVEYLRVMGDPVTLSSEVRRAGKIVGRTRVTVRPDGSLIKAQLLVPSVPAKLEITYYATVPTPRFPPDTWRPPEP